MSLSEIRGNPFYGETVDGGVSYSGGGGISDQDATMLKRLKNLHELNEIGVEKLTEQMEELEKVQRRHGFVVDTIDGRMKTLEEASNLSPDP